MTFSRTGRWFFAGLALAACFAGSISASPADQASFERDLGRYAQDRADLENTAQGLESHGTSPGGLTAWARGVESESLAFDTDLRKMAVDVETAGDAYKDNPNTPCGSIVLKLYGPYGRGVGYEKLSTQLNDELQSIRTAMAKLDERQNNLNHAMMAGKRYDPGFPNNEWSFALTSSLKTLQSAYQSLSRTGAQTQAKVATLNATLTGPKCQTGGKTSVSPSPLPSPKPSPKPSPMPSISAAPKPSPKPLGSDTNTCPPGYSRSAQGGCVKYNPY